jgi:hypothetical protein
MRILPRMAEEKGIGADNYDSPQILRAALTCRTPPGLEGSKGRPALMGVRGILDFLEVLF